LTAQISVTIKDNLSSVKEKADIPSGLLSGSSIAWKGFAFMLPIGHLLLALPAIHWSR